MKKISALFAALWMTLSLSAASYGILVNGNTYYAGTQVDEFEGFVQYLAHVPVQSGDYVQLYDYDNKAAWAVTLNTASVEGFAFATDRYTVSVEGCYDFYIKLKYQQDELYIGNGSDCGEGVSISGGTQGGGTEGGTTEEDPDPEDVSYYAIGWINGADVGETAYDVYDDNYLFVDGKLTIECQMGSYIAIKDHKGNFYYAEGAQGATGSSVTMKWANGWSPCQKWAILEGTQYIIIRSATFKGEIKLESVDKATYDAYSYNPQGIENTSVKAKAYKTIMDGQLRIIRGDKVFDATGRQL